MRAPKGRMSVDERENVMGDLTRNNSLIPVILVWRRELRGLKISTSEDMQNSPLDKFVRCVDVIAIPAVKALHTLEWLIRGVCCRHSDLSGVGKVSFLEQD